MRCSVPSGKNPSVSPRFSRSVSECDVRDAALVVQPVHELRSERAQQRREEPVALELALDHVADRRRQCGEEHGAVEVARMVRDEHVGPGAIEVRRTADPQPDAEGPERGTGEAAPAAPPRMRATGQDHHSQPHDSEGRAHHQSGMESIGGAGRPQRPRTRRAARGGERKPGHLHPYRSRPAPERAALEQLAHRGTPDLPAGGLEDAVRRREDDLVGTGPEQRRRGTRDGVHDLAPASGVLLTRFRDHHQPLGPRGRVRTREDRDAALAHTLDPADRGLQIVRIEIAPGADDEVLVPSGDVELAAGDVAAVSRSQPLAVEKRTVRGRIAMVAGRGRRPAELDRPFRALAQLGTAVVDDPDLEAGNRRPAGDEAADVPGPAAGQRQRLAPARDGVRVDRLDPRAASDGGERHPQGRLREPVDGSHRVRVEPAGSELLREPLHGVRTDRLGPVERDAPAREIQPLDVLRLHPPHAQLVGEVRSAGQGAAVPVDRLEPAIGAREKVERGHEHQRKAVVQTPHPRPDEPHVVIERQPAHEHVARGRTERSGHGPERCQHVTVAEHHPLGIAGAAGGVLEECGGGFVERRALAQASAAVERTDVDHRAQPRNPRGQQPRHAEGGIERHEHPDIRVRKYARVTHDMILELARTRGRVDGHRDRAGHLHPEEGRQVVEAGRQHQRHTPAGLEPSVDEAGRDALGTLHEVGERDLHGLSVRGPELGVDAIPVVVRVEVHRLEQRRGAGGDRLHRVEPCLAAAHRRGGAGAPLAGQQRRQQLPRGLRVRHDGFRNPGAEPAFEPREQLHARQAVEPEIAIERAVERDLGARTEVGVKLGHDLAHRREQRVRIEDLRLC